MNTIPMINNDSTVSATANDAAAAARDDGHVVRLASLNRRVVFEVHRLNAWENLASLLLGRRFQTDAPAADRPCVEGPPSRLQAPAAERSRLRGLGTLLTGPRADDRFRRSDT